MAESLQIIVGIIFLIVVFILTRIGMAHRIRRAAKLIIQDLEMREAFDHTSAAELPYAKPQYFKIGMTDYRPKALESLVQGGIVGKTANGRYYLIERLKLHNNAF